MARRVSAAKFFTWSEKHLANCCKAKVVVFEDEKPYYVNLTSMPTSEPMLLAFSRIERDYIARFKYRESFSDPTFIDPVSKKLQFITFDQKNNDLVIEYDFKYDDHKLKFFVIVSLSSGQPSKVCIHTKEQVCCFDIRFFKEWLEVCIDTKMRDEEKNFNFGHFKYLLKYNFADPDRLKWRRDSAQIWMIPSVKTSFNDLRSNQWLIDRNLANYPNVHPTVPGHSTMMEMYQSLSTAIDAGVAKNKERHRAWVNKALNVDVKSMSIYIAQDIVNDFESFGFNICMPYAKAYAKMQPLKYMRLLILESQSYLYTGRVVYLPEECRFVSERFEIKDTHDLVNNVLPLAVERFGKLNYRKRVRVGTNKKTRAQKQRKSRIAYAMSEKNSPLRFTASSPC